jgi:hypothetical protein
MLAPLAVQDMIPSTGAPIAGRRKAQQFVVADRASLRLTVDEIPQ